MNGQLKSFDDNGLQRINTAVPCVVDAFIQNGTDEPFVNVFPSINARRYINGRAVEFIEKELIEEIPIGYFSTQKFAITIPIEKDDRGWLIAADFNMDLWDIDGEPFSDQDTASFKNFGDSCWFLPGLWPRPKGLDGYANDGVVIRTLDNTTNITVKEGAIDISAEEVNINAGVLKMNGEVIRTINPGPPATFTPLPPGVLPLPKDVKRP